jgi:hypothetical protein
VVEGRKRGDGDGVKLKKHASEFQDLKMDTFDLLRYYKRKDKIIEKGRDNCD